MQWWSYLRNLSYKWPDATEKMLIVSLIEDGSCLFCGALSPKNLSNKMCVTKNCVYWGVCAVYKLTPTKF